MGPRLSKYWNIYWRLFSSLSIGKIYGIFLQSLTSQCPKQSVLSDAAPGLAAWPRGVTFSPSSRMYAPSLANVSL